jgi:arginine decarboxylase
MEAADVKRRAMKGLSYVASRIFLTKGVGRHKEKLASFEAALRNAKIAPFNLVKVSSIFPPHCKLVTAPKGLSLLSPGQVVFCVLSENATDEPHRLIAASVGLAIPKDPDQYGYLSEHKSFGQKEKVAGDYAEDLAAYMLATTLGVDFDPDASYDEKKAIWKINGKIVRSMHITQTAIGNKNGLWTTVIAGAIYVP